MANDFGFTDLIKKDEHERKKTNTKNIPVDEIKENENNNYELVDIDKLATSIEELGLLQPLLVKKRGKFEYELIAGHRRFTAIKKLIDNNKLPSDYEVLSKIIDSSENEIITRLKLHETNLQTRSLLNMEESEKISVVEDYMNLIDQAKKQGIEVNGKPIKGKTRELVAERFGVSHYTAQKIIRKVKEGGEKEKPKKVKSISTVTQLKKIVKQIEKLEFENTEEEIKIKEGIIKLLEEKAK